MGTVDETRTTDDLVVLALAGDHDTYEAERLAHALADALSRDDGRPIVVDLAEATFIDSTVISVLLRATKEAESSQHAFVIHLPEPAGEYVHRIFETTKLDGILPIVDSWAAVEQRTRPNAAPA